MINSLSALQTAQTRLDITANNIANVDTPSFQEQTSNNFTLPNGELTISSISPSGQNFSSENNVDLTTQIVNLKEDSLYYLANAQVSKSINQTLGSLLNTTA